MGYYGPSSHNGSFPDGDTIGHNDTGPDPDVVFNGDPLSGDALIYKGASRVVEDMIYSHDLNHGRGIDSISNPDASLSSNDVVFADEAVFADPDA